MNLSCLSIFLLLIITSLVSCTTEVSIDATSARIEVQSSKKLTATASGLFNPTTITWSSSAPTIASVSSSGLVSALKYGTATIKAAQGSVSATCSVTVFNTLTIVNNTSSSLDLISWNNIYFGNDQVWDSVLSRYVEGLNPGGSAKMEVSPTSSYVYFWFASGGSKYRTSSLVTVSPSSSTTYTLTGSTLVTLAVKDQISTKISSRKLMPMEEGSSGLSFIQSRENEFKVFSSK